ncbi:methyl-accepting chemotaxis protein [Shewanella sp. 1_MG-2023]|uniref:methyl-accepting chemotaxis protein n=1 Tax=unclassified Shewanella TaxID=196818 RepID=UPI0026E1187A|nr:MULTISPECIES: methyl-accepting chemotaxis protein [unclassified Shewanella]MDO6612044.1 methyl-accepting chemotaxis protein [Shewanella sp. 7_MG-2023]MDO6771880.1 methyl-accepting chemotaxis protein [Shewanella sp. 2_MG-2023]MDO6794224.1 methyl-accepting chemotaxis protein [Shewanella sp. 1_MG-2023]
MISNSLKQKILVPVLIALSMVIALLSWLSYSNQKDLLLKSNLEQVQRLSAQQAERISEWLAAREDIINALGEKLDSQPLDALQQAQISGRFEGTYFGTDRGEMFEDDPTIEHTDFDPRTRPWYQEAVSEQQMILTKPYLDVAYNILVVTLAKPILNGVVGGDLSIDSLVDDVNRMTLPSNGFAIMMHKDGTVIAYKDASKAMGHISAIDSDLDYKLLNQQRKTDRMTPIHFAPEDRDKLVWAEDIPNTDWELIVVLDKDTLEAPLSSLLMTQLGISALVLLISMAMISWLISQLLAPLSRVSQALARIADGNGDLTQRIEIESKDEVGTLADSFNRFVSSQHQLISQIRGLAQKLDKEADESLANTHLTEKELQVQQQEVTMVATAVTEMASATQEIAGNAESTATAAQQSSNSSQQGQSLVDNTRQSINLLANEVTQATDVIGELSRHANAITSILSTIQGIAEQTNLLALNAAIEAARAGDQGRGFAVVADEVRVLSRRTQDSAQEIYETIETLQQTTSSAVTLMQSSQALAGNSVNDATEAAIAIEEITQAVVLISDMASQIATAAEEQTQVTNEITQNTVAIKDVTDDITQAAEISVQKAKDLKVQAKSLNDLVATFIL